MPKPRSRPLAGVSAPTAPADAAGPAQPHGAPAPAEYGPAALRLPVQAALLRQLYAAGVPLAEIVRRTGHGRKTLYRWLDHDIAPDGSAVFSPVPRRRPRVPALHRAARAGTAPARAQLLARLWSAAERQVAQIEARIAALGADGVGDSEKDVRALAVLARTLRELTALETAPRARRPGAGGTAAPGVPPASEGEGDGAAFRDLDAFRSELARRLDGLRAEGPGADPAEGPA